MNTLFILAGDGAFGLVLPDPGLVFWTVIIFIILWTLLGKFAFKPIAEALKEREEDIANSLNEAQKAREEMKTLVAHNEEVLKEAQREKSKIIQQAKEAADKIVADSKTKAEAEYKRKLEDAIADIDNKKMAAIAEVKNQVGTMAVEIAEKILKKELDGKDKQENFVASLVEEANLN